MRRAAGPVCAPRCRQCRTAGSKIAHWTARFGGLFFVCAIENGEHGQQRQRRFLPRIALHVDLVAPCVRERIKSTTYLLKTNYSLLFLARGATRSTFRDRPPGATIRPCPASPPYPRALPHPAPAVPPRLPRHASGAQGGWRSGPGCWRVTGGRASARSAPPLAGCWLRMRWTTSRRWRMAGRMTWGTCGRSIGTATRSRRAGKVGRGGGDLN